jgi:chromosome segregation ATPase
MSLLLSFDWQMLQGLAPLLVGFGSLVIGLVGLLVKAYLNHRRRLQTLEKKLRRHSRSLYGDDGDAQQTGVAQDLRAIEERVETLEEEVRDVRRIVERIDERID